MFRGHQRLAEEDERREKRGPDQPSPPDSSHRGG